MRNKARLVLTFYILLFTYPMVNAEVFHWPQICEIGDLIIKNNGPAPANIWLQKFGKNLIRESEIEIGANSIFILTLEPLAKDERYALLNINNTGSFEVKYKCSDRIITASNIEGGILTFGKTNLPDNKIWIQNLYTEINEVQIEFQDFNKNTIAHRSFSLSSLQSLIYSVPASIKKWDFLKISTSQKSSIFNLNATGNEKPLSITPQKTSVDSTAFYFLIGPRTGTSDSFIVKITDEKTVARARDLIKNPQKEKMLFARIQKDHQGFNRNWSKSEKSFWSWSASEVTNFADLGSTACNGVPQEVEDRMDFWIVDPGQICFWNYRVKKELSPLEVANGL